MKLVFVLPYLKSSTAVVSAGYFNRDKGVRAWPTCLLRTVQGPSDPDFSVLRLGETN